MNIQNNLWLQISKLQINLSRIKIKGIFRKRKIIYNRNRRSKEMNMKEEGVE